MLGASNVLADASTLILSGATADLGTHDDTVAALIATDATVTGQGTLTAASYTLSGSTVHANLGTGTLNQIGGRSLLTGTAAAGTITVQAGTLALGAGERLADTAAVTIAAGATLDLGMFSDTVGSVALDGTLAGTGTLTAARYALAGATVTANLGGGTLIQTSGTSRLGGVAGATTVATIGGTLILDASARLDDAAALAIGTGSSFDLDSFTETVATATIMGRVDGAGLLDAGRYTLEGATVNARLGTGTLVQAGGVSTLNGASGATIVAIDDGTLRLGSDGRLSDTAAVTIAAGATLDLAGASETAGSLAGAGTVALGGGRLAFGGTNLDTGFPGRITGSGDLVKHGTGTLALTGDAASTARLVVAAGTVALSGGNGGSAQVVGGTLSGTGTIAGNLTLASGTISPGSVAAPVGMLQAATLVATGGCYAVDVAGIGGGFASDVVRVAGAVTLSGVAIAPRSLKATANYRVGQTYTVLTGATVAGTFANGSAFTPVGNDAALQYRLRYDLRPDAVLLELRRQIDFSTELAADATVNQRRVGAALSGGAFTASDDFIRTLNAVQSLSPVERGATFDLIGGEAASATTTMVRLAANRFIDVVRSRMSANANPGTPAFASNASNRSRLMRAAATLDTGDATLAGSAGEDHVAAWFQGHGADGRIKGRDGTATVQSYAAGFVGGVEARLGPVTIGVGGLVDNLEDELRRRQSRSTATLYQGGGYLGFDDGRFLASAAASYFKADGNTERQVEVGPERIGQASGMTVSMGYTLGGGFGYRLGRGQGLQLAPQLSGRMVSVNRHGYVETGVGGLNLAVGRERSVPYTATLRCVKY